MRITHEGYFDYNATAPLRPQILPFLMSVIEEGGNPSSIHRFGRTARAHIETARARVAGLVGVRPAQIVFSSGATEANNTVLSGFQGRRILVSAIEHPAVRNVDAAAELIPVTADGVIDISAFAAMLDKDPAPALVSIMLVNNETGVIQPLQDLTRMARARGCIVHTDAVQAAGRMSIDFDALDVDFMTLSSHKIGGPQGAGALIFRAGVQPPRFMRGGGQERRQRAGTENVAAIAGFGLAAELAAADIDSFQALSLYRDRIEDALLKYADHVTIHGRHAPRVANTIALSVAGISAETMLMHFDLAGIALSSGSACSSGSVTPSAVLTAMGVPAERARSALRISMGWHTRPADIDKLIHVWNDLAEQLVR